MAIRSLDQHRPSRLDPRKRRHRFLAAALGGWFCLSQALPQTPAAEQTDQRVAGPFTLRADFSLEAYPGLFKQLAQLQDDLVRALHVRPAGERIEVLLFASHRDYRRYLETRFPDVPYRRALYIKAGGPGTVLAHRGPDFEIDLRHECTHALLHAALPVVPLWLDEGLAKYFELPPASRPMDNPFLKSTRWNAYFGLVPRLETLEKEGDFSNLGRTDYRDAWAWVHFLLHGPPEARDEFTRYLGDLQASTPPGQLSARLARRLPNLRGQFLSHFKTWRP